jgi:CLIP-associating protein 1/2
VSALEDTDAHVRECARPSVIELFTGPGVTDAARADLKKEMTKKGVRKAIVDAVLSKLVAGTVNAASGAENPEIGDAQTANSKEYVPPSLMLQSRKLTVGSTSATVPTALTRATSLPGGAKDVTRPDSRAATTEPTTPVSEGAELKPVYVRPVSVPHHDQSYRNLMHIDHVKPRYGKRVCRHGKTLRGTASPTSSSSSLLMW